MGEGNSVLAEIVPLGVLVYISLVGVFVGAYVVGRFVLNSLVERLEHIDMNYLQYTTIIYNINDAHLEQHWNGSFFATICTICFLTGNFSWTFLLRLLASSSKMGSTLKPSLAEDLNLLMRRAGGRCKSLTTW